MACSGKKISQLPATPGLVSTDEFALEASGTTYKMTLAELDAYLATQGSLVAFSKTITTAEILLLNGTPIEVIAAPAAGFAIVIMSTTMKLVFNSVAYATNTNITLRNPTGGTTGFQILDQQTLQAAAGTVTNISSFSPEVIAGNVFTDEKIEAFVQTGNPTAGDSDLVIEGFYRLIAI